MELRHLRCFLAVAWLALESLSFRYAISVSNPSRKPLRAFDDGAQIYIQTAADRLAFRECLIALMLCDWSVTPRIFQSARR